GEDEKNGGLWCSPMANTSRPTSSAFTAILTIASIRSASLGVTPVTGSRVMSLTENTPNCIVPPGRRYCPLPCEPTPCVCIDLINPGCPETIPQRRDRVPKDATGSPETRP